MAEGAVPVSRKIDAATGACAGAWRIFEEGQRLKEERGEAAVYDLSLGNPDLEPPEEFRRVLVQLAADTTSGMHRYMANAGYREVRESVARQVSLDQRMEVSYTNIVMTCSAAGALNVIFKTILDPGDEVIVPCPYYSEYDFYVDNHQGVLRRVGTGEDFDLDLGAIAAALNDNTRAVLINSPNNPTGRVYSARTLALLGDLLMAQTAEVGRTIYLVADEPYRHIVYDDVVVPSALAAYPSTIVVSSASKELSLAGERIGFLAVSPNIGDAERLVRGLTLSNRILGFVNAPALMQRAIGMLQGVYVDLSTYRRNRDVLCSGLHEAGFSVPLPQGAFYLFPRSPLQDDQAFASELLGRGVLAVPGSSFHCPGHFRLAFCVAPEVVDGALPVFRELGRRYCGR